MVIEPIRWRLWARVSAGQWCFGQAPDGLNRCASRFGFRHANVAALFSRCRGFGARR